MDNNAALRAHLIRLLDWEDAHVNLDRAITNLAVADRGRAPSNSPHTAWQLLEHIRLTQHDILDFCRNPNYEMPDWPMDYWPPVVAPVDDAAWTASIDAFTADRKALARLVHDEKMDLFATIPHGSGQTYLRQILLVADHTSYHVGQLVSLRRQLDAWPVE